MEHSWRVLGAPAHRAYHVVIAVCEGCGITRSRAVAPGTDHKAAFTGDCNPRSVLAPKADPPA
jgi:hypothetical protein